MDEARGRLDRAAWIAAARAALLAQGPGALRVEALARDLKASKGSFYWHFRDAADLNAALLAALEEELTLHVAELPHAARRRVMDLAQEPEGSAARALRGWARQDGAAAEVLGRLDAAWTALVAEGLAEAGQGAGAAVRGARLLLAARVGLGPLDGAAREEAVRDLRHLARALLNGNV